MERGGLIPENVIVEYADDDDTPVPEVDERGNIMSLSYPDGSIEISLDGLPLVNSSDDANTGWFDNIVDKIDSMELSRIAEDLLRGIRDDLDSRQEWVEDGAQAIRLLGIKIEQQGQTADGAPIDGMSTVRHPLLLEAVLRFQANARAEMLPTDGPVKIRNDDNDATLNEDKLADAFETDMNHYLTAVAKEYYPDTDRMFFSFGLRGSAFKKVYNCPLRNRPVSETVQAEDLIVNNQATCLADARRITHRLSMRPSVIKRMQLLGVYRDIDLTTPLPQQLDAVQREQKNQQGVKADTNNPDDRDREIYECYCELDIKGFEHKWKGKVTGLEVPYRVTIDVSSREVLSIVRNYDEDDKLCTARPNFVHYVFVPGMGFYGLGLLHILGNTANAMTALLREMIDSGMFANFPGFLITKDASRQNTTILRVPPGGGQQVDTNGQPINQAVMPLPYKEPGPAMFQLMGLLGETGMRIGGVSEQQVGEGRQDAPVGTTLALIEQATKVLNSVHKRMHSAQAEEFALLVRCFRENPEAFWQTTKRPAADWDDARFEQALDNYELVPQADPNTSSHAQRLMKLSALAMRADAKPQLYDPIAVEQAIITGLGFSNPNEFMQPQTGQMPPEMMAKIAEHQVDKTKADASMLSAQAKMKQVDQQGQLGAEETRIKGRKVQVDALEAQTDAQNREADRQAELKIQKIDLAQNVAVHPENLPAVEQVLGSNLGDTP